MARKHSQEETAEIDMTPMLDIVFIMLIFFIVTTSFVREAGIEVNRPEAVTAEDKPRGNILIGITETGQVWMQKRETALNAVRVNIEQAVAEYPESSVVILADEKAPSGIVVQVMDQVRLAGVRNVSIAADMRAN